MFATVVARTAHLTAHLTAAIAAATLLTAFVTVLPAPAQAELHVARTASVR